MFRYERRTDDVQIDAGLRETLKKTLANFPAPFVNNFLEIRLVFIFGAK